MADEHLYRLRMQGEPSSWKPELYANIRMSELFVFRFAIEVPRILGASLIMGKEREDANGAINEFLIEGLTPAFEHLRTIKKHQSEPTPIMNRKQAYEDFYRTLWHAYKDLLQKAVRSIGGDIGFLFQSDKNFENEGQKRFHPEFVTYFRQQRSDWQNDLSRIRNDYLEHRKLNWEDVERFYCIEAAGKFFKGVWTTSEEIVIGLIQSRFPKQAAIREIPESKRDAQYPLRFEFVLVNMKLPES